MICRPEPLKICVVASTYPRSADDYAVPWLRESIRRFVSRGHSVHVLAPSFEGLGSHTIDDVPVQRFRYSPRRWERLTHEQGAPNRIRNPWYQLLGIPYVVMGCRAARKLALKHSFDVIHAHWPFPHEPIASTAAATCGASLVITSHGAEFALADRKKWVRPCLRHSLHKADMLIANSNDTAKKIHTLSGCNAEILPFGSTVEPKSTCQGTNTVPRVLFTGRLIQRKGVDYLLRAIPNVLAKTPAKFIITGDGDQRASLEALAASLGLGDTVEFLGFVSNERLNEEYARCDVWVNPSVIDDRGDTEGLGVGAIEAYLHRKPVVASAVGGIPDAIRHGTTGWLVPQKDLTALTNSILDLVNDPAKARRFGEAGLQFAQRQFDWERITDRLEQIYRSSMDARHVSHSHPSSLKVPAFSAAKYALSP